MTIDRAHRVLILLGSVFGALVMVSCGQDGGSNDPPTGDTRSSITQYQFTWTFDRDYRCGQFVNGDFWVVGPVTITAISPGWDGEKNGSMIDPLPQNLQGYDSRASYYDAGLTADRPADMPLTLQPGSSLVSTLGLESSHATYGRSFLRSAAVLTVLDTEPPDDAFRPPYAFGSKPLFRFSDVDISALPILTGTAATPDTSAYMGNFQRVWLDHMEEVANQDIHPVENMETYSLDCHGDTTYHDEGTVTVTNSATQVQGAGTNFTAADRDRYFGVVGTSALNDPQEDWNTPDGSAYRITAVDVPNQTLTLA
ncbi:MAG: hypothetical protein PVI89_03345 [Desulfobacteraceae bacterium]|jgi:hypothetical protein